MMAGYWPLQHTLPQGYPFPRRQQTEQRLTIGVTLAAEPLGEMPHALRQFVADHLPRAIRSLK